MKLGVEWIFNEILFDPSSELNWSMKNMLC